MFGTKTHHSVICHCTPQSEMFNYGGKNAHPQVSVTGIFIHFEISAVFIQHPPISSHHNV